MSKLSVRQLINIAHDAAKESFGRQEFNFPALWARTWARAKEFKKESIENWIGTFYTELLIDPRFVLVGGKKWKLREFMDYGEYLRASGRRVRDVTFIETKDTDAEVEGVEGEKKASGKTKGRKKASKEAVSYVKVESVKEEGESLEEDKGEMIGSVANKDEVEEESYE